MNILKPFLLPDERELIDSIEQNGSERKKGEERLFTRYAYFIKEAIHKYSLSEEEAFDVYSDAILSAIEKISNGSFQRRSSLKTWVYQIFHNKYVDFIRKKSTNRSSIHRTLSISDPMFEVADTSKTIIQELMDKTDWKLLREKLNQIGDNCRQMLLLWADGYSDKEIALAMEYKTSDVVKTSRLRCLEKLKQLYRSS
ncbi:MAG: RNA polymerase subunit sigma-24 [Verrucomicrobia bacterium]|nr:MAG: RNA polymerase subunit sigma-24 [Verrucomicrobiota bacterium]